MAGLEVRRPDDDGAGGRRYKIFVDGKVAARVAIGATQRLSVSDGRHQIYAKIDWCQSDVIDFEVREDQVRSFSVASSSGRDAILEAVRGPGSYLDLHEVTGTDTNSPS